MGSRPQPVDPQTWARRRKEAIEKASRLREERKRGRLDENHTFSPHINEEGQQSKRSPSKPAGHESDGNEHALASAAAPNGRTLRDEEMLRGLEDVDSNDRSNQDMEARREVVQPGSARVSRIPRLTELSKGSATTQGGEGSGQAQESRYHKPAPRSQLPRRSYTTTTDDSSAVSAGTKQSLSVTVDGRARANVGRGANMAATMPSGALPREIASSRTRGGDVADVHDDGEGRDRGQPSPRDGADHALDGQEMAIKDREAHDAFSAMLRSDGGPLSTQQQRRTRQPAREPKKRDWNSETYVPSAVESSSPRPLPPSSYSKKPSAQRSSRPTAEAVDRAEQRGDQKQKQAPAEASPSSTWRHKHTRPEWIESWEARARAGAGEEGEKEQELDSESIDMKVGLGVDGPLEGGGRGAVDGRQERAVDDDLRPNLFLLKVGLTLVVCTYSRGHLGHVPRWQQVLDSLMLSLLPLSCQSKMRSQRGSRRSQSAPHGGSTPGSTDDDITPSKSAPSTSSSRWSRHQATHSEGDMDMASPGAAEHQRARTTPMADLQHALGLKPKPRRGVSYTSAANVDAEEPPVASSSVSSRPSADRHARTYDTTHPSTDHMPSRHVRRGTQELEQYTPRLQHQQQQRSPQQSTPRQEQPQRVPVVKSYADLRGRHQHQQQPKDHDDADTPRRQSYIQHEQTPSSRGTRPVSSSRRDDSYSTRAHESVQSATEDEAQEFDDADLIPCPSCRRKFLERAYQVHQKVCKKVFQQKRKAFDSRKARVDGTEAAKYVKGIPPADALRQASTTGANTHMVGGQSGASGGKKAAVRRGSMDNRPIKGAAGDKKSKWRQQSEAFRDMIKQNRVISQAEKAGKPLSSLPPPVRSEPDPSLIPCPHCGRRFNEKAAERHIPKCTSILAKPKSLSKGSGIALGAAARSMHPPDRKMSLPPRRLSGGAAKR